MLQLTKNEAVAAVAEQQVRIRQLEINWYTAYYGAMTAQAALVAGFAFSQLTEPIPDSHHVPFTLEFTYLVMTATAIGFELCAILCCTLLSVWGPGLALRGPQGSRSVHLCVNYLRSHQSLVFAYFLFGWACYFVSIVCELWIFYRRSVAWVASIPMVGFVFLSVYYSVTLTAKLRVAANKVVEGQVSVLEPYEQIGDLDDHLKRTGFQEDPSVTIAQNSPVRSRLASQQLAAGSQSFASPSPIPEEGDPFRTRYPPQQQQMAPGGATGQNFLGSFFGRE